MCLSLTSFLLPFLPPFLSISLPPHTLFWGGKNSKDLVQWVGSCFCFVLYSNSLLVFFFFFAYSPPPPHLSPPLPSLSPPSPFLILSIHLLSHHPLQEPDSHFPAIRNYILGHVPKLTMMLGLKKVPTSFLPWISEDQPPSWTIQELTISSTQFFLPLRKFQGVFEAHCLE